MMWMINIYKSIPNATCGLLTCLCNLSYSRKSSCDVLMREKLPLRLASISETDLRLGVSVGVVVVVVVVMVVEVVSLSPPAAVIIGGAGFRTSAIPAAAMAASMAPLPEDGSTQS